MDEGEGREKEKEGGESVIGFQQHPVNFHHLDLVGNLICPINRIHLPHRSITVAIHLTLEKKNIFIHFSLHIFPLLLILIMHTRGMIRRQEGLLHNILAKLKKSLVQRGWEARQHGCLLRSRKSLMFWARQHPSGENRNVLSDQRLPLLRAAAFYRELCHCNMGSSAGH